MLASCCIETRISDAQAFHRTFANDVRLYNFVHVREGYIAVPDAFGVHHDGWAVLALVQATGLIRPHLGLNSDLGQLGLEGAVQVAAGGRVAATARMSLGTLVAADKDMFFKLRHGYAGFVSQTDWDRFVARKRAAHGGPRILIRLIRALTRSRIPKLPGVARECTSNSCFCAPTHEGGSSE